VPNIFQSSVSPKVFNRSPQGPCVWCMSRSDDSAFTLLVELALVLAYTSVLIIKSCNLNSVIWAYRDADDIAEAICSTMGWAA
jgi:hypothetical protein